MEKFTASNGIKIQSENGFVIYQSDRATWLPGDATQQALREFSLAERDAELGRWRWSTDPDYVVYPHRCGGVRVLNEATLSVGHFESRHRVAGSGVLAAAARAYFAAHPVPRPWEDAKPGEIWRLTTSINGDYTAAVILTSRGDDKQLMFMPVDDPEIPSLGLRAPIIVTAVRWPDEGETTT